MPCWSWRYCPFKGNMFYTWWPKQKFKLSWNWAKEIWYFTNVTGAVNCCTYNKLPSLGKVYPWSIITWMAASWSLHNWDWELLSKPWIVCYRKPFPSSMIQEGCDCPCKLICTNAHIQCTHTMQYNEYCKTKKTSGYNIGKLLLEVILSLNPDIHVTINRAWNRNASFRLTQWLKIIPHMIRSYCWAALHKWASNFQSLCSS